MAGRRGVDGCLSLDGSGALPRKTWPLEPAFAAQGQLAVTHCPTRRPVPVSGAQFLESALCCGSCRPGVAPCPA